MSLKKEEVVFIEFECDLLCERLEDVLQVDAERSDAERSLR